MRLKERTVAWLESGKTSAEIFKMSIMMGALVGAVYFIRHDLPEVIDRFQENRRLAQVTKERDALFEKQMMMIDAAHKEKVRMSINWCDEHATESKALYINCLNKIHNGEYQY